MNGGYLKFKVFLLDGEYNQQLILFVQIFFSGTLRRYTGAVLQRNL
jgi:hypothetical protein